MKWKKLTGIVLAVCMSLSAFSPFSPQTDTQPVSAATENFESAGHSEQYNISSLTATDGTVTAEYSAESDCTLVIGFYNDDCTKMYANTSQVVSGSDVQSAATVKIPSEVPEHFVMKAFLLDSMHIPLCDAYTNIYYSNAIAEVRESVITDYDPDFTINFDDDDSTNFAVLREDTILLNGSSKKNTLKSYDPDTGNYIFINTDQSLKGCKPGDVIYYDDGDGSICIKIKTISVSGTTVTITEDDSIVPADVFDVMKIEFTDYLYNNEEIPQEYLSDPDLYMGLTKEPEIVEDVFSGKSNRPVQNKPGATARDFSIDISPQNPLSHEFHLEGSLGGCVKTGLLSIDGEGSWDITYHLTDPALHFEAYMSGIMLHLDATVKTHLNMEGDIYGAIGVTYGFDLPKLKLPMKQKKQKKTDSNSALDMISKFISWELTAGARFEIEAGLYDINTSADVTFNIHSAIIGISVTPPIVQPTIENIKGSCKPGGKAFLGVVADAKLVLFPKDKAVSEGKGLMKDLSGLLDCSAHFKAGLELQAMITGSAFGDEPAEHSCKKCLSAELSFIVEADAHINFGGSTEEDNDDALASWEAPDFKFIKPIVKYYHSYTYNDSGWCECPHKGCVITFKGTTTGWNPFGWIDIVLKLDGKIVSTQRGSEFELTLPADGAEYTYEAYNYSLPELIFKKGTFTADKSQTITITNRDPEMLYPTHFDEADGDDNGDYIHTLSQGVFTLYRDNTFNQGVAIMESMSPSTGGVIPSTVRYNGKTYYVTFYGENESFAGFTDLTIPSTFITEHNSQQSERENYQNTGFITVQDTKCNHVPCGYFSRSKFSGISLPDTILWIGSTAFMDSENLSSITLPEKCYLIGKQAFMNSASLSEVNLADCTQIIAESAFANCQKLEQITLPDEVVLIDCFSFADCSALKQINIPEKVEYIGESAFENCNSLTKIALPASVEKLDHRAFRDCTSLKSVELSEGLKYIGECAFENTAVESLTIPSTLELAEPGALVNMEKLKKLILPEHNPFADSVINNAPELRDIYYAGTFEDWYKNNYDETFHDGDNLTVHCLADGTTLKYPISPSNEEASQYFVMQKLNTYAAETTSNVYVTDAVMLPAGSVTYSDNQTCVSFDAAYANGRYLLIAAASTDEPILNSSNLRYIDQQTADDSGTVRFQFEKLSEDTIYLLFGQIDTDSYWRYTGQLPFSFEAATGDLNGDGSLSVADVVLLQKWLLAVPDTSLPNWKAADFCKDGQLDVFDLCLMKRALINKEKR